MNMNKQVYKILGTESGQIVLQPIPNPVQQGQGHGHGQQGVVVPATSGGISRGGGGGGRGSRGRGRGRGRGGGGRDDGGVRIQTQFEDKLGNVVQCFKTGDGRYECPLCPNSRKYKHTLKVHYNDKHVDASLHKCIYCGSVIHVNNLTEHVNTFHMA